MKRLLLLLLISLSLGCAKSMPDDCYKPGVTSMYLCTGGEKMLFYESRSTIDFFDLEGKKSVCATTHDAPCDIYYDTDYCPRVDYCAAPDKETIL